MQSFLQNSGEADRLQLCASGNTGGFQPEVQTLRATKWIGHKLVKPVLVTNPPHNELLRRKPTPSQPKPVCSLLSREKKVQPKQKGLRKSRALYSAAHLPNCCSPPNLFRVRNRRSLEAVQTLLSKCSAISLLSTLFWSQIQNTAPQKLPRQKLTPA